MKTVEFSNQGGIASPIDVSLYSQLEWCS